MGPIWIKYNTQSDIRFTMVKRGVVDLAVSADWTPATADAAISKDGGNFADCTNTIAIIGGTPTRSVCVWKLTITAAEASCAEGIIQVVDAATKAVEDNVIRFFTYGNASAKFAGDWSDLVRMGLTALPNANAAAAGGLWILGANAAATTTLTGVAAVGATPATPALQLTGGAASTTGGGTAAQALLATGGAGAASTNGAAEGVKFAGGGTNTVASNAHGLNVTGTSTGSGLGATSGAGATGDGITATSAATNGNGMALTGVGSGNGLKVASASGDAINAVASTSGHGLTVTGAGTTKHGINATGGATSSDGIRATGGGTGSGINAQSGSGATGNGVTAKANSTNGHGIQSDGAGTGDGMQLTKGASGADLDADIQGTLDTVTTAATATNVTTVNGLAANVITAAATAADFGTEIATAIWTDTTAGDFTVAASIGKSIMNGVALGTGLTINAYTGNTVQTGDSFARIGANGIGLTSVALADATSDAVIADAVWNAATASYGSAGTYGLLIETDLDATISSRLATAGYTAPPSAADNAAAVWDLDATAHQTQGTFGQAIGDPAADANTIYGAVVTGATGATIAADIITIDDFLDTEIAAIKAVTDALPNAGALTTIQADLDDIQTRLPAALVAGRIDASVGAMAPDVITAAAIAANAIGASELAADAVTEIQSGLATAANQTTIIGYIDTEVASILTAVDTEIGAIKAKTDSLNFTVAGQVDANIQSVNDVTVTGNGQAGTEWGP